MVDWRMERDRDTHCLIPGCRRHGHPGGDGHHCAGKRSVRDVGGGPRPSNPESGPVILRSPFTSCRSVGLWKFSAPKPWVAQTSRCLRCLRTDSAAKTHRRVNGSSGFDGYSPELLSRLAGILPAPSCLATGQSNYLRKTHHLGSRRDKLFVPTCSN